MKNILPRILALEHDQEKYRNAPSKGKIENGVLTSEPIDVRLHIKQQVIDTEFYYRDARIYRIFDGTSEIHRTVVAQALCKGQQRLYEVPSLA